MNALGWELDHSKRFQAATEEYCSRLHARTIAGLSDPEYEKFDHEMDQLKDFVGAAHRLLVGEIDPISLPRLSGPDGAPISNYHILNVGPWHGIYLLDPVAKTGVGTFACNENVQSLKAYVREALEEAQKAPKP